MLSNLQEAMTAKAQQEGNDELAKVLLGEGGSLNSTGGSMQGQMDVAEMLASHEEKRAEAKPKVAKGKAKAKAALGPYLCLMQAV